MPLCEEANEESNHQGTAQMLDANRRLVQETHPTSASSPQVLLTMDIWLSQLIFQHKVNCGYDQTVSVWEWHRWTKHYVKYCTLHCCADLNYNHIYTICANYIISFHCPFIIHSMEAVLGTHLPYTCVPETKAFKAPSTSIKIYVNALKFRPQANGL